MLGAQNKTPQSLDSAGSSLPFLAETEAAKSGPKPVQCHPSIFQQFKDLRRPSIQFTLAPSNPIRRLLMG